MRVAAVAEFLAHLEVERRMSVHTLDAYARDLAALAAWARPQGLDVVALQTEQLRAFVASEHRRGLSPKSLQRRLSACRSFYRWLLRHGHIVASPATGIRAPKAPRKLPQVLDADEAARLVEVPTQFDDRSFDQFAAAYAQAVDGERLLFDAHAAEWASPYGLVGLLAAGEAAGFGGGGMHGYRSLEGTFLGGCIFSGRAAGRVGCCRVVSFRRVSLI